MIITCPSCNAQYDADDSRFLPGGRTVRCSQCTVSWFVPAPQPVETLMPESRIPQHQPASPNIQPLSFTRSPEKTTQRPQGQATAKPSPQNPVRQNPLSAPHLSEETLFEEQNNADQKHYDGKTHIQRLQPVESKWAPLAGEYSDSHDDNHHKRVQPAPEKLRRRSDHIVETKWEAINDQPPYKGPERRAAKSIQQAKQSIRKKLGSVVQTVDENDVPSEFFASINVQPRELENALKRVRRKAEAREKNRLTPLRLIGWALLFTFIFATIYSGYRYRDDVVRLWPGSEKVYASIGIKAHPYGLSLDNITHRVALSTNGPVIEISGELFNKGDKSITPPLLLAEVLDEQGRLLSSWTFKPDSKILAKGARATFQTRHLAPNNVTEVVLSIAPEKSQINRRNRSSR